MLKSIARMLGLTEAPSPVVPVQALPRVPVKMAWRDDTRFPTPDWQRMEDPEGMERLELDAYWTSAALAWLEALADRMGGTYRVQASDDFLLLSSMDERKATLYLASCQRILARVTRALGPLANDTGYGRYVVIAFHELEPYAEYVAQYYPDDEDTHSGAVYLNEGYGHVAMVEYGIDRAEATIAHMITLNLLGHLPLPTWLRQGIAQNIMDTMFPRLGDPRSPAHFPGELEAKHAAHWNKDTIQDFWFGEAFRNNEEPGMLAFDLSAKVTALAARDEHAFRAFVGEAHWEDGGLGAEHHLGFPLRNLVEAVLGEGDWQPRPPVEDDQPGQH